MGHRQSSLDGVAPAAPRVEAIAPSRNAALQRLDAFAAGPVRDYARQRNFDRGPGAHAQVSRLSPHIRHRLVTEAEVVGAVLARHHPAAVEKFVQEVFWRSYWKGWLELRPAVWSNYQREVVRAAQAAEGGAPAQRYAQACAGRTGLACFDAWAAELAATGYLHNHARMWFASIWVHTLDLPWQLGADFFLRHLLDGDPASNTLSWRWVAGIQTPGKAYLARADNIARFTEGRFAPSGLATTARIPADAPVPAPQALALLPPVPQGPAALLLTEEDLHPESLPLQGTTIVGVAAANAQAERSRHGISDAVAAFTSAAQRDALERASAHFGCPAEMLGNLSLQAVLDWCRRSGETTIVTPHTPVGPAQDRLRALAVLLGAEGIAVHRVRRAWDEATWPLASRGFFAFAGKIPALLRDARLVRVAVEP